MTVKLTLIDQMLGTKALSKDVFGKFIASLAPTDEQRKVEMENAAYREELEKEAKEREESGTSVFHRDKATGKIGLYAYQIKGFFKDAAEATNRFDADLRNNLEKLSAYKKKIDQCIFVSPDFIPIQVPNGGEVAYCERPLRAQTAQGERVTLVRSESVPVGSTLEMQIKIFSKELVPYVEFWLGYGILRGIGQWRNSGKGRFQYAEQEHRDDGQGQSKAGQCGEEQGESTAGHSAAPLAA